MRGWHAAMRAVILVALAACAPGVRPGAHCAMAPAFAPFDDKPRASRASEASDGDAPAEGAFDALIAWYQRRARASELPGMGCPFAPSCSRYARGAIHRHGPLALFLIVDRLLVREHAAAAAYYAPVCVAHAMRLEDDVP